MTENCVLDYWIVFTVIPQDDGLMDLWIAGLLGLNSKESIEVWLSA